MSRGVLRAVAFWPGTPLMVDGVNPRADASMLRLRSACRATVGGADLGGRHLILIGEGDADVNHDENSWGTLAGFGVDVRVGLRSGVITEPDGAPDPEARILPPTLTTGLLVASGTGVRPARVTAVELAPGEDGARRLADVLDSTDAVVIAIGEGSARATHASPGPYTPDAAAIDARIIQAISDGDTAALADVTASARRAGDLQMSGLAAWAAVCSILEDTPTEADLPIVHVRPFGVEYFVGRWLVGA